MYSRVFPGIFFTLGYFRVCRVFSGISGYVGYLWVFTGIYKYIRVDVLVRITSFSIIKYMKYGMGKYIFNGGEGRTNEKQHQRCM